MATTTKLPNDILPKDANEELVYTMDWDRWMADGAAIANSVWTITSVDTPAEDPVALTKDNEAIAVSGRSTSLRLKAGTLGNKYKVTNLITTNESPAQKGERSFFVKMKDL